MNQKTLVALATAGITLFGAGFFWGSNLAFKREETKNLEQIVVPQESIEQIPQFEEIYNTELSNEEKKQIFYIRSSEILSNVSNRLIDFVQNLHDYSQKQSEDRVLYLAQAKEDLINVDKNLAMLQKRTYGFSALISNKFTQHLYNIQYSHQQFMQKYADELENVFTAEGVADYNIDIKRFGSEQNKDFKDVKRELESLIRFVEREIEK